MKLERDGVIRRGLSRAAQSQQRRPEPPPSGRYGTQAWRCQSVSHERVVRLQVASAPSSERYNRLNFRRPSGGTWFAHDGCVTLIELVVVTVMLGVVGGVIGALVGWIAVWSLLSSAVVGAVSTVLVGATVFAALITSGFGDDEPPCA